MRVEAFSDFVASFVSDMNTPEPFDFRSPHGINRVEHRSRCWNKITVRHVIQHLNPGRVWHDISSKQTTVAILLDQTGGEFEQWHNFYSATPRRSCCDGHPGVMLPDIILFG